MPQAVGYLRTPLSASLVIYGIDYARVLGGGGGGGEGPEEALFAFLGLLADVVYTRGQGARTEPFPGTRAPVSVVVILSPRARKGHGISIL